MTTEENDRIEETAVSDSDETSIQPVDQSRPVYEDDRSSELIKFGLLVLVFVVIVVVVALARPFIFDKLVPAIMGTDLTPTPAVGVGGAEEATAVPAAETVPAPGSTGEGQGDVFLPALTSDEPDGGGEGETAVTSTPEPAAETAVPSPITHVVQPGDTLTKIARQYNVSVQALMQANNLLNANYIQVGQTLVIPANP